MSPVLLLPLAAATIASSAWALVERRRYRGAVALAGSGILLAALFFALGFPGLAVVTLAVTLGVAAAGLVVGRRLTDVEARSDPENATGPWLLAAVSSALLTLALGLGVAVVDWPSQVDPAPMEAGRARRALAVPSSSSTATASDGALLELALAGLGVAAALALAAFTPRSAEE